MRHTAAAIMPTGDFLAHVGDWTGLPPAELLGLMRGSSPVSAGASEELGRLIAAIGRRHDLVIVNVFHAGDGNLHQIGRAHV